MPGRPPQPPQRPNPKSGWALKALGLVMVAMVSGMLWWLIQQSDNDQQPDRTAQTSQQQAGKYSFIPSDKVPTPLKDSICAKNAYGMIQDFLAKNRCEGLTRAFYTTTVNSHQVYTSVAVVRMVDAAAARALKALTDKDETGNVNDLVKEGIVKIDGLKNLGNGGYASELHDNDVIIIESDWAPGGSRTAQEKELLKGVSKDAMRLGDEIRNK